MRVSKDQWLATALDALESEGIEGVKIERLAKSLGTSRSGFYWHFKNRQDLLEHLLEYWVREFTGVISGNPQVQKLEPEKRLLTVMEMVHDHNLAKYELAVNAWAKHDPNARKVLKKVVKVRLEYLRSIFAELGFEGDELEMRAHLFVCYQSWESTMFSDLTKKKQHQLQTLRHRLYMKR